MKAPIMPANTAIHSLVDARGCAAAAGIGRPSIVVVDMVGAPAGSFSARRLLSC